MEGIVRRHIPKEDWGRFVFHAMELHNGGGYFARDKWPKEKRFEILDDLMDIPRRFGLWVSFGFIERAKFVKNWDISHVPGIADVHTAAHTTAFGVFAMSIEKWMRMHMPDEIGLLIAEDTDRVKPALKSILAYFRSHESLEADVERAGQFFPFVKIRDTVHFAKKEECRHLQIADACTYAIKRHLMKKKGAERFYEPLNGRLLWYLAEEELRE